MAHNHDLEINTSTEPSNNPIHEAIQFYWGERCPEHEDGCPVCEAWRQYDNLLANNVFVHVPLGMTFAPPRSLSLHMMSCPSYKSGNEDVCLCKPS